MQYGVLTVYFSNRKLRDIIVGAIEKLQNDVMPMQLSWQSASMVSRTTLAHHIGNYLMNPE